MKTIEFPPWYGEFGWEVASWVPQCRKQAQGYEQVIANSFEGMQPLYADFITEFRDHGQSGRSLKYPKKYRPDGKYFRYGDQRQVNFRFDILLHARGIGRKGSINYKSWDRISRLIKCQWQTPLTFAVIGTPQDKMVGNFIDLRGMELASLMDQIAAARLVVGVSSGLMHLAAFCGTNLVVWGDRRTYFGETLEKRYKQTWNPFDVNVGWIDADDFQPEPEKIIETIKEML